MREITCYAQTNQGTGCQEWYATDSGDAVRRSKMLKNAGYEVKVSVIGQQVTSAGVMKITAVNIRPGKNKDTFGIPPVRIERF